MIEGKSFCSITNGDTTFLIVSYDQVIVLWSCQSHRSVVDQLAHFLFACIAQLVEQRTVNPCVLGSSPSAGAF